MKKLYEEVCKYIGEHNNIADNLYNGILLEVYNEYSYAYEEGNKLLTLKDLEDIADNVIGNDYFGEILTECIRQEMEMKNKMGNMLFWFDKDSYIKILEKALMNSLDKLETLDKNFDYYETLREVSGFNNSQALDFLDMFGDDEDGEL